MSKIQDLEQKLKEATDQNAEFLELLPTLESKESDHEKKIAYLEQLLQQSRSETEKVRHDSFEAGKRDEFNSGREVGREEGHVAGRQEYLQSEAYKAALAEARLQGARDFLRAPAFKIAVETKAADFHVEGFDKCQAQLEKLGGFAEGFDRNRLDPSLTANLKPYPEEAEVPMPDDEFSILIEEVEKMS
ncbi:UNVERIFIED_CONTAM: hypothetical protein Slati_4410700 [Sesamum latifolium]|uniref:Uncharacterized protein n=1 Tax=Sesamum latifolium TaxID=2727402 RepID=A0AAW2SPH1_9LAMI